MRKTTPYNTGKVAIGSRYEPAKRHTMSLDELRIQNSLINHSQQWPCLLSGSLSKGQA